MAPHRCENVEHLIDTVIEQRGRELTVAFPLGLGKPNHIANELIDRAFDGQLDRLDIITALSLTTPPPGSSELQQRLMEPILDRVYADVPQLDYVTLRARGKLPESVSVQEFFHAPGTVLSVPSAQRNHRNVNFTDGLRMMRDADLDLIGQMVAPADEGWDLSCNTDISVELLPYLRNYAPEDRPLLAAQVNRRLPRLGKTGVVDEETFDLVVDDETTDHPLFSLPNMPISNQEYAIGLQAASLLRDGGTVQIGIGGLGAALAYGSILRHEDSATYTRILDALAPTDDQRTLVEQLGGTDSFDTGLYASTEMFVEGLLHMAEAGVLNRDIDGTVLHGAFYLGSRGFYEQLRNLDDEMNRRISMKSVRFTNLLYGNEETKRKQRRDARFFNSAMMVTAFGSVVSDGLEDGRVVSGVGGQYEFVSQAHYLEDGRSVIMVPATRRSGGKVQSNIVYSYGHTTVPRHLRDIVVTEYGIADLRGRSDREVIEQLIGVCDARFQQKLVDRAREAGKLPMDYQIPDHARKNRPERIDEALQKHREEQTLPRTPFGSALSEIELDLAESLQHLKGVVESIQSFSVPDISPGKLGNSDSGRWDEHLKRMGLARPESMKERVMRQAILYGLRVTH